MAKKNFNYYQIHYLERFQNQFYGNSEIKKLMDDMLETMYAAPGIGLAAVQIGILKRVIVIDLSKEGEKKSNFYN